MFFRITKQSFTVYIKYALADTNRLLRAIGGNRKGLIIHDVSSVKYNKENEIFSHSLTCFQDSIKKWKNRNLRTKQILM